MKMTMLAVPVATAWLSLVPAAWCDVLRGDVEIARQLNDTFAQVVEKACPSVVIINVVQKASAISLDDDEEGTYEGLPPGFWKEFHKRFKDQVPENTRGQGSGIVLRANGYILTNRHVVQDAESIEVRLQDGRTFKAVVRAVDPQSDLAVIKIDATGLPVANFGDSDGARVGEFAIAIGAPFSLDYTVTFGHVSAKGRSNIIEGYEGAAMDQDFIQTDALINPGNSGGPLLNIDGKVIGINTLIRGLHSGIGFAIPSNLAREVSDQLISEGKYTRAWLGISIQSLHEAPELRDILKGVEHGVVVKEILSDGPAANSQLKTSDIITAVDGESISSAQQLRRAIRTKIGQAVTLQVVRDGKPLQVTVSPGRWEEPPVLTAKADVLPKPSNHVDLGITVQPLTAELAASFGAKATEGVVVASVEKNSVAARKGIKAGDIITSIDQTEVRTPRQFREAARQADLKKGVLVNLMRNRNARFELLKQDSP